MKIRSIWILIAVVVITIPLFAQVNQHNQSEEKEVKVPITQDHHKMNHLAAFVGGTAMLEKKGPISVLVLITYVFYLHPETGELVVLQKSSSQNIPNGYLEVSFTID